MTYAFGYFDGYGDITWSDIAGLARSRPKGPDVVVAQTFKVSDEIAARWIREAAERGHDIGRPRGDK